jgi:hypothetical protein
LPAAATTTTPASIARWIASASALPGHQHLRCTRPRGQREVDHARAGGDRGVDAAGDRAEVTAAVGVQCPDGQNPRAGGGAGDADAVAGVRGDDPAHVRPVAVGVVRVRVAVDEVGAGGDVAGQIGVRGVDAGVDHRDQHAGAGRDGPRLRRADHVEVPLQRPQRVVRRPRGARHQRDAAHERSQPGCARVMSRQAKTDSRTPSCA